jgi:hypothetical protein
MLALYGVLELNTNVYPPSFSAFGWKGKLIFLTIERE